MSTYISVTVNCDGAQSPAGQAEGEIQGVLGAGSEPIREGHVWWRDLGDISVVEARRILKYREGWTCQTIDGHRLDLCPACTVRLANWREANGIKRSARATG